MGQLFLLTEEGQLATLAQSAPTVKQLSSEGRDDAPSQRAEFFFG